MTMSASSVETEDMTNNMTDRPGEGPQSHDEVVTVDRTKDAITEATNA